MCLLFPRHTSSSHCFHLSFFQWDEVSVLDDKGKLIRTFEVCNVNQNQRLQDNWLATPFLYRHSAPRVFVTLRFSVRDCASLRSPSPTCRETLTLYYKQADSQRELERTWVAEVRRELGGKCDAVWFVKHARLTQEKQRPHKYRGLYGRIKIGRRTGEKHTLKAPYDAKFILLMCSNSSMCL